MKWIKTKHIGVRYREHPSRKFKRRPDRSYQIYFKRGGKLFSEVMGWESEGLTDDEAARIRSEILKNIRHGEGFQSLKEKRRVEETRRLAESKKEEAGEKENITFDSLATEYMKWARSNKNTWTQDHGVYQKHIKKAIGHMRAKDVSPLDLERFKRELLKKGLSERSAQSYLNLIKHIFNKATAWELFSGPNPVSIAVKSNKGLLRIQDNRRLRFLSFEESERLLDELDRRSPQWREIALISLRSGLRANEIFGLTWGDIDLENEIITVRDAKNSISRQTYMSASVKVIFQERKQPDSKSSELVFKSRNGDRIREVSETFQRAVDAIGLNDHVTDRRNRIVFHSLRHSFASHLALRGESLLTLKELLGHRDIKMTLRYSHLLEDHKRVAIRGLEEPPAKVERLEGLKK